MKRALWYLWNTYIGTILACVGIIGALGLVCTQWLHIEFFAVYYYMLPMMVVIYVAIFGFNLTTLYRNVALSFNCRRTDFFWASQIAFLVTGVASTAITWLLGALPRLLGLEYAFQEKGSFVNGAPIYVEPGIILLLLGINLFMQPIGVSIGGLYSKSKVWSAIWLVLVMILSIAGTVVLLFASDGTLPIDSQNVKITAGVIVGVLGVICAVCEVCYFRSNGKAVVR